MSDQELRAFATYYRTLGAHMGIEDVPLTYEDFERERTLDTYVAVPCRTLPGPTRTAERGGPPAH